jgi:hypothetical protein
VRDVCGGLQRLAEQTAVAIEAPGTTFLADLDARLVVALPQLVGFAGSRLVGEFEGF